MWNILQMWVLVGWRHMVFVLTIPYLGLVRELHLLPQDVDDS